ncbi:hypothetical protein [Acidisoma sp. C75]
MAMPIGRAGKHDVRLPWGGALETAPVCAAPLFGALDIKALADAAGYPEPPDSPASAKWLDLEIRVAASGAMMAWNRALPQDHHAWNALVHLRATELLNAFGFVDADDVLNRERIEALHGSGLALGGAAMQFNWEARKAKLRNSPICVSAEVSRLLQVKPTRLDDEDAFVFVTQMFAALPWLIGALAKGAGATKGMTIASTPRRRGNTPKHFQGQVFNFLRQNFQNITGQPLSGLRKADDEGAGTRNLKAPPVLWCKVFFALIAERVPARVLNAPPALIEEARGLAALSQGSIAEYLARKPKGRSKSTATTE